MRSIIKKGELQAFLDKEQPDILCIQEIKLCSGQTAIDLPDYRTFYNCADRPGYSGTAILVRKFLSDLQPINVLYDLPNKIANRYNLNNDAFGNPNTEGRVLTIELADFFLTTVYTPNSKDDLSRLSLRASQWDPAFRDYISELQKTKPVIFCGDLNVAHKEIDLARPKPNIGKHGFTNEERAGFGDYLDIGMIDSYRKIHGDKADMYTWWTHWAKARERNVGWRIDYFLVDKRLNANLVGADIYSEQMGSDHCPISISLEF